MHDSQIVADVTPQEVDADLISGVFSVKVELITRPNDGVKQVIVDAAT